MQDWIELPLPGCDCSDEFGPCEKHADVLVVREGASLHTADELALLLIDDLVSIGEGELSAWGQAEYGRLKSRLELGRSPVSGTAWFDNPDDADSAQHLAFQVENNAADVTVVHNDGYVIYKLHDDCPLHVM